MVTDRNGKVLSIGLKLSSPPGTVVSLGPTFVRVSVPVPKLVSARRVVTRRPWKVAS